MSGSDIALKSGSVSASEASGGIAARIAMFQKTNTSTAPVVKSTSPGGLASKLAMFEKKNSSAGSGKLESAGV